MLGKCFVFSLSLLLFSSPLASQPLPKLAEEQDYTFCIGLFKERQYQLALEQLRRFVEKHPSSSRRAEATFLISESLFLLGQYDSARNGYEEFLREYPSSKLRPDVMFRLGEVAFRNGDYRNAITRFSAVREEARGRDLGGEAAYWLGESYYKSGNHAEALRFYRLSRDEYPGNPLADYSLYSQGWILKEEGKHDEALPLFQALIAGYPNSSLVPSAHIRIGECLFQARAYRKTIDHLTPVRERLAGRNEQAEADYLIAESYFSLGEYPSALRRYEDFLSVHPGHRLEREVRYSLGWIFLKEQNYPKSIAIFKELSSGNDEVAQASAYRHGVALKLDGRGSEAREVYSSIVTRWPTGPYTDNAIFEMAVMEYENRKFAQAREQFQRLIASHKESDVLAESYRMLGETSLALGDHQAARDAFSRAGAVPNVPADVASEALFQEGWTAYKLDDYDGTITLLKKFLSLYAGHGRTAEAHFWLAESYYQKKSLQNAYSEYRVVTREFPKHPKVPDALYGAGWSSFELRNYQAAVPEFRTLVSHHQKSPHLFDAYLRLGDSYFYLKDYGNAARTYRAATEKFPGRPGIDYAFFQLAESNVKGDAQEKGLQEFSSLIAKFPSSQYADDAVFGRGWVYFQRKEYRKAIDEWRTIETKYPNSDLLPKAEYAIGDTYYNMGEYEEAITSYRAVLRKYPSSPYTADAVNGLRYCYAAQGDEAQVDAVIDEYVSTNRSSGTADRIYLMKGDRLAEQGLHGRAAAVYLEFPATFPDSDLRPDADLRLAQSYVLSGDTLAGVAAYQKFVTRHKKHSSAPLALSEAGVLQAETGNVQEAVRTFDVLKKQYPGTDEAKRAGYRKGRALLGGGDLTGARREFEAMRSGEDPDREDLAQLGLGLVSLEERSFESALSGFGTVIGRRTDDLAAEAQYYSGEALFRQQRYQDAATQFLRVKFVYPASTEWIVRSYLRLGECYEKLQDVNRARDAYRSVLTMNPDNRYARIADERMKGLR